MVFFELPFFDGMLVHESLRLFEGYALLVVGCGGVVGYRQQPVDAFHDAFDVSHGTPFHSGLSRGEEMYVGAEEDDGEGADFREDAADDVHGFFSLVLPLLFSVVGCCPADGRRADAEDLGDGPVAESGRLGFQEQLPAVAFR